MAAVRVITEARELEALKDIWESLLEKGGEKASIFLTHERISAWWRHFGSGRKLNVLLVEDGQRVIGIIPLMRTAYRLGFIKIEALETIGASNSNLIGLASSEDREKVVSAFLRYLRGELVGGGLLLRLTAIPEDSQFLAALRRGSASFSKSLFVRGEIVTLAPYIELPATWDEYFGSLSRKRRWVIRRALEKLEKAHKVRFEEYAPEAVDEGLSRLFDLHQKQWRAVNITSGFSRPEVVNYWRDVTSQFLKRGWLHFSRLTADGEVVSVIYGCIHNQTFYAFISGRDTRYREYSVGHLHYMFLIKEAIRRQLREFNLLKGKEPYKFYWAKSARQYLQFTIMKAGFCPRIRLKLIQLFFRYHGRRQSGFREAYYRILKVRRDRKERAKMGLG